MRKLVPLAACLGLLAAPAAAQDWERFYPLADVPEGQVLVLDPSIPRGEPGRYRRLDLAHILPAGASPAYAGSMTLTQTFRAGVPPRAWLDVVTAAEARPGALVVVAGELPVVMPGGAVLVRFRGASSMLHDVAGVPVAWASLARRRVLLMVRSPGAWTLLL